MHRSLAVRLRLRSRTVKTAPRSGSGEKVKEAVTVDILFADEALKRWKCKVYKFEDFKLVRQLEAHGAVVEEQGPQATQADPVQATSEKGPLPGSQVQGSSSFSGEMGRGGQKGGAGGAGRPEEKFPRKSLSRPALQGSQQEC